MNSDSNNNSNGNAVAIEYVVPTVRDIGNKSWEPECFFISTGDKTSFYTLRAFGYRDVHVGQGHFMRVNTTQYYKNLSTDKDKAIEEMKRYAQIYNLPYEETVNFDLNEIRYSNAEQREKQREMEEKYKKEIEEAAMEAEKSNRAVAASLVEKGNILVGEHHGKHVSEIPQGLVEWFAGNVVEGNKCPMDPFQITAQICYNWARNNMKKSEWIGNIGQIMEAELIIESVKYMTRSQFGGYVVKMKDENGNKILTFTTRKGIINKKAGEKVWASFEVKNHSMSYYEWIENSKVTEIKIKKSK
jgi:hypothetical protein